MFSYRFVFLLITSTVSVSCSHAPVKHIIGAVETVQVQGLAYQARIDTGADITSIHAYDIRVDGEAADLTANIGKLLRFVTANEKGQIAVIQARIVKINTVRNVSGRESRYVVELPIAWGDYVKIVEVNLRDRSNMRFALLIGRNWLRNDFVVDVSGENERLQQQNDTIEQLLPRILTQ